MDTDPNADRHREVTYLTGRFLGEHISRVYRLFDGDLVAAIVLATVAQRNLQRFYEDVARRADATFDQLLEREEHLAHLRHCNALSVSAATGVPRETVRRKVRMLEQKGWLRVGEHGELLVAPRIGRRFASFDQRTNAEFERYARAVLRIIDAPRGRRRQS